eukprot:CAMPEP_0176504554 /NCGR_PEP_ID=MMETSP0200_2-20121128/16001_1 /TAXON_ID=947934 /ORGANISM="Chaetoceros sp., Strain GSL56" /LENGTH=951 /DNA_ID=CAMNT_0017904005 /DNA_START=275 /DNA_END=3127 /DNA_ORIENTATION=-
MLRVTIAVGATLIIIVLVGPMMPSYLSSFRNRTDAWIHKELNNNSNNSSSSSSSSSIQSPPPSSGLKQSALSKTVPSHDSPLLEIKNSNIETQRLSSSSSSSSSLANHSTVVIGEHKHHHSNPMEILLPSIGEPTSAAEKLQCPANVLSFVINATDVKDECEGLRKAFDKTCGGGSASTGASSGAGPISNAAAVVSGTEKGNSRTLRRPASARRRLTTTTAGMESHLIYSVFKTIQKVFPDNGKWDRWSTRFDRLKMQQQQKQSRRLVESSQQDHHDVGMQQGNADDDGDASTRRDEQQQQQQQQQQQEEDNEEPLSATVPDSNAKVTENIIEGALLMNTDYLITNHTTEQVDSMQGQGEILEKQIDDENVGANQATQSKSNEIATPSTETTTSATKAHVPEAINIETCCRSILNVFHDECDTPEEEEFNDKRLFVIVCVIALCGVVKSLIRHFKLRWLPEAGGCILVGMVGGLFLRFLPNMDFGFQHDMFLRVMVPPIVFEAALNINKRSFSQMSVPIVIFAVWGTFMSTILSAAVVYYATRWIPVCPSIPFVESLAFGALISSIDPIAVLSVLSNMGMSAKDPIYVLIFGESLLNDGVAIVLFQTLVHFMDEKIVIDSEACWLATLHFLVIAFGSLFVGLACGFGATLYFWLMKGIQTPLVEVLMFLCWAFIPYYICDGVDWSGIVAIVAAGFFMDVYVIGTRQEQERTNTIGAMTISSSEDSQSNMTTSRTRTGGIFSQEGFLSTKAKNHIGFVTEINSTLMETAIFAYLGIFLLNKRYHWNFTIPLVAVMSCIFSRSIMVVFSSALSNTITRACHMGRRSFQNTCAISANNNNESSNRNSGISIDPRMQVVLIFAGLRGAMSFALVETVPMYDQSTGEGSRYKPELKAMTSACIVFTVFILGGYTYYLLVRLGLGPVGKDEDSVEMVSLINGPNGDEKDDDEEEAPW